MVAEVLVGNEPLAEEQKRAGRFLFEKVDHKDLGFLAAFWQYSEQDERWRLYFVTALADTVGPLTVYGSIRESLYELSQTERSGLDLIDITVASPESSAYEELRRRFRVVDREEDSRYRRVDAPYIYTLRAA